MIKLHLGCGVKHLPGFINVDNRPEVGPDIVADAATLDNFESNSVSLIYACHVFEYFGRHEYQSVLARWYDVLEPGGILRLSVPDFDSITNRYLGTGNLTELWGLLYAGQRYPRDFHRLVWDFKTLALAMYQAGFHSARPWVPDDVHQRDWDDYSKAYLPHMDSKHGRLMSLNIQALK